MARYLGPSYEPIPDELLRSGADLVDVVRRIARNQNWIWSNHGNVIAACGQEPSQMGDFVVTTGSVDVAYFACPNRSATGSDSVRVAGFISVTGTLTTINGKVRLYQLLPGETAPTADSPYDDGAITTSGEVFFDFNARIRSGGDPLRFCLRVVGGGTATYAILTVTVTWARNPASVLGETVATWQAISQGYVQPDRAGSAALLRAISNRTLRIMADNPRPIFTHSFVWPRVSTAAANTATVARHMIPIPSFGSVLTNPQIAIRLLVTGQNAVVDATLYTKNLVGMEATHHLGSSGITTLQDGVYLWEGTLTASLGNIATKYAESGGARLVLTVTTPAANPGAAYVANIGAALLGLTVSLPAPTSIDLALPGSDTIPAAYQPLDDHACAPGRPLVAQDDRLGRRAGPHYLVKNLVWLAANRTAHVLVADWMHQTQSAGWWGASGTSFPGDGFYRNQSLVAYGSPGDFFPLGDDRVPWALTDPTDPHAATSGHHFRGDVLGRFYCRPLNGGKLGAILRPDVLYMKDAPGVSESGEIRPYIGSTLVATHSARSGAVVGGFQTQGPYYVRPTAGQLLSFRAKGVTTGQVNSRLYGMQLALHAAYVYELPLSQGELDALP